MLQKSWAAPNHSINVEDLRTHLKTHALLAAISDDLGLECYMIKPKSIN
jgi:hypothetical protein